MGMQPVGSRRTMDPVWVEHLKAIVAAREQRLRERRERWEREQEERRGDQSKAITRRALKNHRRRQRVYKRDGYRCVSCRWSPHDVGEDSRPRRFLTLDHIVPRSKGGTNALSNLQTMCNRCNNRKGDKIPEGHADRAAA